jgi:hypothetical protein
MKVENMTEKEANSTMEFLEEYGIFEDKHAIEVASRLETEGFTCPIKTREEFVKWLDTDTVEFPSYDITKINRELRHYKRMWTDAVIEKMTVEELREFRKIGYPEI